MTYFTIPVKLSTRLTIYLESLKRVPVWTTADVDAALLQLIDLSDAIGHEALENYLQQERPLSVTESNSSSVA